MFIAFVGSRSFTDYDKVDAALDTLAPGSVVVVGTNRGVDTYVATGARRRSLPLIVCTPGPVRNRAVRRLCDKVMAFGKGPGCRTTIDAALSVGLPVEEIL